ncbi:hypothetical protein TanjilG_25779 [Lupinus angustifolius]|uniref:Uncharacterized protein n=1 Tax=Lupinus angustifolius TaxID=3871 RepID=A0A394DD68_LUPAN|nr:hypothetical protein TanjilG_25779 [Lupinus angustifolius]
MKIKQLRTSWRKIKRENSRILCSSRVVNVQYDPNSYLKNFDDAIIRTLIMHLNHSQQDLQHPQ